MIEGSAGRVGRRSYLHQLRWNAIDKTALETQDYPFRNGSITDSKLRWKRAGVAVVMSLPCGQNVQGLGLCYFASE